MAQEKPTLTPIQKLLKSDGALGVTFANTGAESKKRRGLATYDDLLAWGLETGAVGPEDGPRLSQAAAEHPGKATGALRSARTLVDRLQRIFGALTAGKQPAASDLQPLNAQLRRAMATRQLDPTGRQWIWGDTDGEDLDRMLWPVLLSAADLLVSDNRKRLRRCPGQDCGLFFIARNSGLPRKWCTTACCNRRSSRLHYHYQVKPERERRRRSGFRSR